MTICIRAWHDLNTCRSIGMSLGPIPVTAIFQWCVVEGLDREATAIVREVIRIADGEFLARQASRLRMNRMTGGQ